MYGWDCTLKYGYRVDVGAPQYPQCSLTTVHACAAQTTQHPPPPPPQHTNYTGSSTVAWGEWLPSTAQWERQGSLSTHWPVVHPSPDAHGSPPGGSTAQGVMCWEDLGVWRVGSRGCQASRCPHAHSSGSNKPPNGEEELQPPFRPTLWQ